MKLCSKTEKALQPSGNGRRGLPALRGIAGFALLAAIFLLIPAAPASARNPISSYLLRLVDESKAEIAIGSLLADGFIAEFASGAANMPGSASIGIADTATPAAQLADDEAIKALVADLATRCPRPTMPYSVTLVESRVPADIPFPGGPIVITTALWMQAQTSAEKEFLIARNLMHVALRQPMNAIKHEGLYARILKLLKERNRDPQLLRLAVRDYVKAAETMDQIRADREGIMLSNTPKPVRDGGISLLKRLSVMLWPFQLSAGDDFSARMRALELLVLP
ncbi:MAG TPA: hypothetical protein PKM25_04045 [Candidatus Ozemobacteraceae bacterium]|mgnify:CR=1 FL=1|nr:hypothetical protein [Candidatus Ozemobacteraceae bacterium]